MTHHQELHNLLEEYGTKYQPESYLEIGVLHGNSLKCLLNVCTPQRIVLCDRWDIYERGPNTGNHDHILPIVAGLNVRFLDGDSHVLIKALTEKFSFITVDGDHSAEGARQDLEDAWPLLDYSGLLFFDDIYHPKHLYLNGVMDDFLVHHEDARLVRREFYRTTAPGCGLIQKI